MGISGFVQSSYYLESIYSNLNKHYKTDTEFGCCTVCGNKSRFTFHKLFNKESVIIKSNGYDESYTRVINAVNSLNCERCDAKFRVRSAAGALLEQLKLNDKSISDALPKIRNKRLQILETASTDGIFTEYMNEVEDFVSCSEFFDDVVPGDYKGKVQCQDLTRLTYDDQSFDVLISLDVLEHVDQPYVAFSEIYRVLKDGGIGIITVPIDYRNHKTIHYYEVGKGYIRDPKAYHADPLRTKGALVYTEFGLDIVDKLFEVGIMCELKWYTSPRINIKQPVLVIRK